MTELEKWLRINSSDAKWGEGADKLIEAASLLASNRAEIYTLKSILEEMKK